MTNGPLVFVKTGIFGQIWTTIFPINQATGPFAHSFQPEQPHISACPHRNFDPLVTNGLIVLVKTGVFGPLWTKIGPMTKLLVPMRNFF